MTKPTLKQHAVNGFGQWLWGMGARLRWSWAMRLGWDMSSWSSQGHVCKCGKRSRTEREHLTHECDPSVLSWLRDTEYDA